MRHKVEVREWSEARAREKKPLDVVGNFEFDGPSIDPKTRTGDVTGAVAACRGELARRYSPRKVHGVSYLSGGGFAAVIAPAAPVGV